VADLIVVFAARQLAQQVREVEQLNLLCPTTLLLDYMVLKKLLDVAAKSAPIFLG
jgi:hypothetical protein